MTPSVVIEAEDEVRVDTGAVCLSMLLAIHGKRPGPEQIIHEFSVGQKSLSTTSLARAARAAGLKARAVRIAGRRLDGAPLPAIAKRSDGSYVVLAKLNKEDRKSVV